MASFDGDDGGDMDMDELFDREEGEHAGDHCERHFTEVEEELEAAGSGERCASGARSYDDELGDQDDDMEELDENAEYIPGSSFVTPHGMFAVGGGGGEAAHCGSIGVQDVTYDMPSWPANEDDSKAGSSVQHRSGVKRAAEASAGSMRGGESMTDPSRWRAPCVTDFKIIRVIGKGSFGKVFLVRQMPTGAIYAMKVLKKENIVKRNQVEHTKTERSVLGYVRHPFVVGLNAAFQTRDKLFFVLDYCAGGELFCHLQKIGKFAEPRARFYTAELVLALAHVHALGVVYRDLKPENVLLDARGHVRLTDFGLSKEGVTQHARGAHSFCGTPEYLAPEILARRGHGRAVDWWSLGALLYEMLTGLPPFYSRDREKLFEGIKSGELQYPNYLSDVATRILRALLHREPAERLGSGPTDADEIKDHLFFASVEWEALLDGSAPPPWTPTVVGSLDTSQFDREFTSLPIHSPPSRSSVQQTDEDTFSGFTYAPRRMLHHTPAVSKTAKR